MKVLGLDIASQVGFAYSSSRDASGIISGSFKATGTTVWDRRKSLSQATHRLMKEHGVPDYVISEAPKMMQRNTKTSCMLFLYWGAIVPVIEGYGAKLIEGDPVSSETWRSAMYGFGKKRGWSTKEWKTHAKLHCEKYLGVTPRNADEAEAILISQFGYALQQRLEGVVVHSQTSKQKREKQFAMEM